MISLLGCAVLYKIETDSLVLCLTINLTRLFASCMLCHGNLAGPKSDFKHLTCYHWVMSADLALGECSSAPSLRSFSTTFLNTRWC